MCSGKSPKCTTCQGTGEWRVYRCPRSQLKGPAWAACLWASGVHGSALPNAGGVLDQPAAWSDAVALAKTEMHAYQNDKSKEPRNG